MSNRTPSRPVMASSAAGGDSGSSKRDKSPARPPDSKDEKVSDVMKVTAGKLGAPNPMASRNSAVKPTAKGSSAANSQDSSSAKDSNDASDNTAAPAKESGNNGSAKTATSAKDGENNSAKTAPPTKDSENNSAKAVPPTKDDTKAAKAAAMAKDSTNSKGDGNGGKQDPSDDSTEGGSKWSGPHLIELAQRGDWSLVDQAIRGLDKGHPAIARLDEVNELCKCLL